MTERGVDQDRQYRPESAIETDSDKFLGGDTFMKSFRSLFSCIVVSLGLLSGTAQAQVVTEFFAGITAHAIPQGITAGPDGNLWFAEQAGRIGRITPGGVVTVGTIKLMAVLSKG
jgi:hypothetical protein